MQCQDSPCPVCRYDHAGLNETLSQCHICGTTDNIYICLICGVASCWNHHNSSHEHDDEGATKSYHTHSTITTPTTPHASHHYTETHHAYALDTQTQHVWDFAGRGYVHRLLYNEDDGKIVEINDPEGTTSHGMRSLVPPEGWSLEEGEEGEAVYRKLQEFSEQYSTVLKNQLEHQRMYYEGILEGVRRGEGTDKTKITKRTGDNRSNGVSSTSNYSSATNLIAALKQNRNQLQQRNATLKAKYEKVVENISFLKNLNESLEANKEPMRKQIDDARQEIEGTKKMVKRCIPPLEEKIKHLIQQIEGDSASGTT